MRSSLTPVRTMEQAGQIDYLSASGLAGEDSYIVVEVHYYRDRLQGMTGFHKDTVGQTVFVNLNYLNEDEEIAGPEFVVNPRNVPAHEEQIATSLPQRYLDDLAKARRKLPPPQKSNGQETFPGTAWSLSPTNWSITRPQVSRSLRYRQRKSKRTGKASIKNLKTIPHMTM